MKITEINIRNITPYIKVDFITNYTVGTILLQNNNHRLENYIKNFLVWQINSNILIVFHIIYDIISVVKKILVGWIKNILTYIFS